MYYKRGKINCLTGVLLEVAANLNKPLQKLVYLLRFGLWFQRSSLTLTPACNIKIDLHPKRFYNIYNWRKKINCSPNVLTEVEANLNKRLQKQVYLLWFRLSFNQWHIWHITLQVNILTQKVLNVAHKEHKLFYWLFIKKLNQISIRNFKKQLYLQRFCLDFYVHHWHAQKLITSRVIYFQEGFIACSKEGRI